MHSIARFKINCPSYDEHKNYIVEVFLKHIAVRQKHLKRLSLPGWIYWTRNDLTRINQLEGLSLTHLELTSDQITPDSIYDFMRSHPLQELSLPYLLTVITPDHFAALIKIFLETRRTLRKLKIRLCVPWKIFHSILESSLLHSIDIGRSEIHSFTLNEELMDTQECYEPIR